MTVIGDSSNDGVLNGPNANLVAEKDSSKPSWVSPTFSNSGTAVLGSFSSPDEYGKIHNKGDLTINDSISALVTNRGTFTYNGAKSIVRGVDNWGVIYATQGVLNIEGHLRLYTAGSEIWKNKDKELANIRVTEDLSLEPGASLVADEIVAEEIRNRQGVIKANKITALSGLTNYTAEGRTSQIEAGELTLGNYMDEDGTSYASYNGWLEGFGPLGNSSLTIHNKLIFDSSKNAPTLENVGKLFLVGNHVVIEGEGKLINREPGWGDPFWVDDDDLETKKQGAGLIAKNIKKDPVENLTIKSELINQGELHAKNLSVFKGVDGIEQADGSFKDSHAFNVENLTVLEKGTFAIQSSERSFNTVRVENGSSLNISKNVVVKNSLTGVGSVQLRKDGDLTVNGSVQLGKLNGEGNFIAQQGAVINNIDQFSGTLQLRDDSSLGSGQIIRLPNYSATLAVPAGFNVDKASITVGRNPLTEAASNSSLKLLAGSALAIVAGDDYDGTSPLFTAPSVEMAENVPVYVYNAAKIKDGTVVINTTNGEEPTGFEVFSETDNLFKVVKDNKIQTLNAQEALGNSILGGSVFSLALAHDGVASERVIALTTNTTKANAVVSLNKIALMGTASGSQIIAMNASNLQLDVIDTHGSALASYDHDKSGMDLWIDLNGSHSKAGNYSAGTIKYGYKSELGGVTIGSDYAFGNGYATGVAISFGKGSIRGQGEGGSIKNEVDYYGLNLYGVWSNIYFNAIGSVGYLQTKNEIKALGHKGKPDSKAVSLGLRFEKPLAVNESITITPHVGVRYKHIKEDSFSAGGFNYSSEKANLVEIPFGVAFNANLKGYSGADVKPFIDVAIAPNFGDRKVTKKIGLTGGNALDSFEARIANNAVYNAKLGLNVTIGNHSLNSSYSVGGGNYGRLDQTLQLKYRYSF